MSLVDWSTKNRIAIAFSGPIPPVLNTRQEKIALHSLDSLPNRLVVFTPDIQDSGLKNLVLLDKASELHSKDPINNVKWDDLGMRLLTTDESGTICLWNSDMFGNVFQLEFTTSINEKPVLVHWCENYKNLSFANTENEYADLKKRALLGFQNLQDGPGFIVLTVSGKLFYFFQNGAEFSFEFIQLIQPSEIESQVFSELFEHVCNLSQVDVMVAPDSSCLVAAKMERQISILKVSFDALNKFSVENLASFFSDNDFAFKLVSFTCLAMVSNKFDTFKMQFIDFSSGDSVTRAEFTMQGTCYSLDKHSMKCTQSNSFLLVGTEQGQVFLFDSLKMSTLQFKWPLFMAKSIPNEDAISFSNRKPVYATLLSPNDCCYAVFQSEFVNDQEFLSVTTGIAKSSMEMTTKNQKFISYILARHLIAIINSNALDDLNAFNFQSDISHYITFNMSRMIFKSYNEYSVLRFLIQKEGRVDLYFRKTGNSRQFLTLRFNALFDQICACFTDPFKAKDYATGASQLALEAREDTLFHLIPLLSYSVDTGIRLVRLLWFYLNIKTSQNLDFGDSLLLFCPVFRPLIKASLKLASWVHGQLDKGGMDTLTMQVFGKFQAFISVVNIDELILLVDSLPINSSPLSFDDLHDLYIKGVLPRVFQEASVKESCLKIIQDNIYKLFQREKEHKSPAGESALLEQQRAKLECEFQFFTKPLPKSPNFLKPPHLAKPITYFDQTDPDVKKQLEIIQSNMDIISNTSLYGVHLIRQCNRCWNYSAGYTENSKSGKLTKVVDREYDPKLTEYMKLSPFESMYLTRCICGGSWNLVVDLRV